MLGKYFTQKAKELDTLINQHPLDYRSQIMTWISTSEKDELTDNQYSFYEKSL